VIETFEIFAPLMIGELAEEDCLKTCEAVGIADIEQNGLAGAT
jgi:hypothetical protein